MHSTHVAAVTSPSHVFVIGPKVRPQSVGTEGSAPSWDRRIRTELAAFPACCRRTRITRDRPPQATMLRAAAPTDTLLAPASLARGAVDTPWTQRKAHGLRDHLTRKDR